MRLEMVHRDQRLAGRQRDRLARGEADEKRADEARAGGGGDAVELGEAEPGLLHRRGNGAVERFDMGPCGNLGDDAAKGRMIGLAEDDLRPYVAGTVARALDHSSRRFVAAGLDSEDDHPGFPKRLGAAFIVHGGCTRVRAHRP